MKNADREGYAPAVLHFGNETMASNPVDSVSPEDHLTALRDAFCEKLAMAVEEIRAVATMLCRDDLAMPVVETLANAAMAESHRLAGSGGTFGYPEVSRTARALELFLRERIEKQDFNRTAHAEILREAVSLLETAARQGNIRNDPEDEAGMALSRLRGLDSNSSGNRVFIVDDDIHLARSLKIQLEHFGYEVMAFQSLAEAKTQIRLNPPAAIVLDLMFPEGELAGITLAADIHDGVPLVVLSSRSDFTARLAAAKAGCAAYLLKPLEINELLGWLDEVIGDSLREQYRVLVVDDDLMVAEQNAFILSLAGVQTRIVKDPDQILEILADFRPDLVLMDLYMPTCTGLELAAVIRQFRQYLGIPIVFLSAEADLDRQLTAMRPGADDFLTKPIRPHHLVRAVTQRTARARSLMAVMERDSLTGLLNHTCFKERLAVEAIRARRHDHPLSLALLDLDHFKLVNDTHGHVMGDQVIKSLARLLTRRLRRTDIIGRYGGEEFAVLMPETDLESAWRVLDQVREAFGQVLFGPAGGAFSVTLSAGVALLQDALSIEALVHAADETLYVAKRNGRDRVEKSSGDGNCPGII